MKKTIKALFSIGLFLVLCISFLFGSQCYLKKELEEKYTVKLDKEVAKNLSTEKFQGIYIQNKQSDEKDILLYGSSELSTTFIPEHPNNLYANKNSEYNISVIGRGHCQSIVHAINIAALQDNVDNKKIAVILSPQWFTKEGLSSDGFEANFSELQFYNLMNNKKISNELKVKICSRVSSMLKNTSNLKNVKIYSDLYSSDSMISKLVLTTLKPYYYIKEQVLYTLDLKQSLDIINNTKVNDNKEQAKKVDWKSEMNKAEDNGENACTNNEYGIYDDYFNKYIKKKYTAFKGVYKEDKYTESPEFEDLNLLIQICKETGVNPLLISVPVHGKWYDYAEFDKTNREEYYEKIRKIASTNGVNLLDLSSKEYEKYFLCDIMHLGWKGWLHINEGINEYYNEN